MLAQIKMVIKLFLYKKNNFVIHNHKKKKTVLKNRWPWLLVLWSIKLFFSVICLYSEYFLEKGNFYTSNFMHISLFKIESQFDFSFFSDALNIWTSIKSEDHSDFIIDQGHIYHHYFLGKKSHFGYFPLAFEFMKRIWIWYKKWMLNTLLSANAHAAFISQKSLRFRFFVILLK